MCRIRSPCCARAASGHAAAALPRSAMNSRRFSRSNNIRPPNQPGTRRSVSGWRVSVRGIRAILQPARRPNSRSGSDSAAPGRRWRGSYAPDTSRDHGPRAGRLRATKRLSRRSNEAPYSITSSAAASRLGGTVRPSALAVLRLTASSNFVGSWTGRSAGLAPFRIRSI
jgi:hypothetical protein